MNLEKTTGISFLDQSLVSVYPNPVSNLVNIKAPLNSTINIFNLTGSLVYSSQSTQNTSSVNVSDMPNGTYLVRIVNNGKMLTRKINIIK